MRRLNRRDFLRLSAVIATGATVAACQSTATPVPRAEETEEKPTEEKPAAPAEKAKLLYQDWGGDTYPRAWEEVGHVFADAHPQIDVEYRSRFDDYLGKLLAQSMVGTAPDIFDTCCADSQFLWKMGSLLVLDPYVEQTVSEEEMEDMPANQIEFWRAPDTNDLYGWPKYQSNLMLFVNLELAGEAGVTCPQRWDEAWTPGQYREVLKKLTKGELGQPGRIYGGGSYQRLDRSTPFLLSNATHSVNPKDNTECWLGKPESQEVLEFWRVVRWEDHTMPDPSEVAGEMRLPSQFSAMQIATMEEGAWALPEMSDKCHFAWDVAPTYQWPEMTTTMATTDGWSIYAQTQHPDAAWDLMLFLSGPVYGKAITRAHFLQPARLSLMDHYLRILRQDKPVLEQVNLEILKEARERDLGYPMELYSNQSVAEEILNPAFQQVFELGRTGVDAIAEACSEVNEILRAERAKVD